MPLENSFFCVEVNETQKIITLKKRKEIHLRDCDLLEFSECLKDVTRTDQSSNRTLKKTTVSEDVLIYLDGWFMLLVNKLENQQNDDLQSLEVITDILRFLRNCTVNCPTQQYIIEKTNILNSVDSVFSITVERNINGITLKVLLQFLINLIISNKDAGDKIFILFYDRIKTCLKVHMHVYELSALIYYISLLNPITDAEIITMALELYHSNSENEFLIFFLENNISNKTFWMMYEAFKTENKTIVLETLKTMLLQKGVHNLPFTALERLVDEFLKLSGSIFNTIEKEENGSNAYYISLLLEILSSLSGDEVHLKSLQKNRNLLVNAGALLINIHKLGKESDNCFTPVQKLTEFKTSTELNEHPAFGFKADLIRLIGNLCWKNVDMQNLLRTAELIPLILDCCNMDARNPFIIQWSILAVRNLCENNSENQKIIAGLYKQGDVSSEVLEEMGITVHSDGENELKIISLENLRKD